MDIARFATRGDSPGAGLSKPHERGLPPSPLSVSDAAFYRSHVSSNSDITSPLRAQTESHAVCCAKRILTDTGVIASRRSIRQLEDVSPPANILSFRCRGRTCEVGLRGLRGFTVRTDRKNLSRPPGGGRLSEKILSCAGRWRSGLETRAGVSGLGAKLASGCGPKPARGPARPEPRASDRLPAMRDRAVEGEHAGQQLRPIEKVQPCCPRTYRHGFGGLFLKSWCSRSGNSPRG